MQILKRAWIVRIMHVKKSHLQLIALKVFKVSVLPASADYYRIALRRKIERTFVDTRVECRDRQNVDRVLFYSVVDEKSLIHAMRLKRHMHRSILMEQEATMDFTRFINSKDIREYHKEIGYQYNALEAAWLVSQYQSVTLEEKHIKYWSLAPDGGRKFTATFLISAK